MPSFLPVDVSQLSANISNATSGLPPQISSAIGNKLGSIGNSSIINKVQQIAGNAGIQGPNGTLFKQQSAFPFKKPVSFLLRDRDGQLLSPPAGNIDGFSEGYFFKMHVNPSNFAITQPPKTVVPIRTLGGWKLQYWYPELGSIRADGMIGNMLERFNRDLKESAAWNGFRKLLNVYKTQGIPYTQPGAGSKRNEKQRSFSPIAVCIFDKVQYEGYFESLEYTESQETPHTINYSFSFKFANTVDLRDIPGITRESAIDASVFNAIVPQSAIGSAINNFSF